MKSKKIITSLFDKKEGSFFVSKPLSIAFIIEKQNSFELPKVGFTVSKSKFKRAVDRNRIKRQMRFAYRKNKHILLKALIKNNFKLSLMIIYNKNIKTEYLEIEKALIILLKKITNSEK